MNGLEEAWLLALSSATARHERSSSLHRPLIGDGEDSVVTRLTSAVCATPWRRTRVEEASLLDLNRKISRFVKESSPVKFSVPFGGYKNWRLRSAPNPDWAEAFALSYLTEYASQIAALWAPGVDITFTFSGGVMDIVSNMPPEWQSSYVENFQSLLTRYASSSVRLSILDITSLYPSRSHAIEELYSNFAQREKNWSDSLSPELRAKKLASARHNFIVAGVADYSGDTTEELDARIYESAILCDSLDSLTLRRRFNKYDERIQLVYVRGPLPSIHIGACATSAMHFWVGEGLLEARRGRLLPRVLSTGGIIRMSDNGFSVETREVPAFIRVVDRSEFASCRLLVERGA